MSFFSNFVGFRNGKLPLSAVFLVILALATSACSSDGDPKADSRDRVTIGVGEAFSPSYNLDPYQRVTSGEMYYVLNNTYERLIDQSASGELVPVLATKWSSNDDGSEWTFNLREGVKFHDGTPLTSKDVVWSFEQMLDPANKYAATAQFGTFLDRGGVTATDANTVVFKTKKPTVDLPLQISYLEAVVVKDGSESKERETTENGTGAYQLKSYKPGSKTIDLSAFSGYWQEGKPETPAIRLQEIVDSTARTSAIQSGQVDVITNVDLASSGALKKASNLSVVAGEPSVSRTIEMQVDTPPFDNPQVRKALKLIADRDFMVKTVMLGYAEAGNDQPIPPSWSAAFSSDPTAQNISEAKRLLTEAGYGDGKPLKLELYAAEIEQGSQRLAEAYKEMAKEAGVEVTLRTAPLDSWFDVIWMKKPFFVDAWAVRQPSQALPLAYGCSPTYDATKWCNQKFEAIMKEAQSQVDEATRTETFKRAQEVLNDDGGVINLLFAKYLVAISDKCDGYEPPVPYYQTDLRNLTCS